MPHVDALDGRWVCQRDIFAFYLTNLSQHHDILPIVYKLSNIYKLSKIYQSQRFVTNFNTTNFSTMPRIKMGKQTVFAQVLQKNDQLIQTLKISFIPNTLATGYL